MPASRFVMVIGSRWKVSVTTGRAFEFFIQWHLTERCNLRCRHCYQNGCRVGELSLDQIQAVISEVAETMEVWSQAYGIPFKLSYNVTGGEPFLRSDLFEILKGIINRKADIFILTNGTIITEDQAQAVADIGVKGVQVSLEGPEQIHEAVRGKGSFTKALRGVRAFVGAGMPVTLNTTLSRINAEYVNDLIQIARECGATRLGFARLVPAGRGAELLAQMLDSASLKSVYSELLSLQMEDLEVVIGDPVATRLQQDDDPEGNTSSVAMSGCAAAVSGLTLLSDGTIVPCRRLPISIGNVLQDSLREIWAMSPVLNRLRDRSAYKGRCGTCERWSACRGCRAIAYACSKDERDGFLDDDPQCFFESRKERVSGVGCGV